MEENEKVDEKTEKTKKEISRLPIPPKVVPAPTITQRDRREQEPHVLNEITNIRIPELNIEPRVQSQSNVPPFLMNPINMFPRVKFQPPPPPRIPKKGFSRHNSSNYSTITFSSLDNLDSDVEVKPKKSFKEKMEIFFEKIFRLNNLVEDERIKRKRFIEGWFRSLIFVLLLAPLFYFHFPFYIFLAIQMIALSTFFLIIFYVISLWYQLTLFLFCVLNFISISLLSFFSNGGFVINPYLCMITLNLIRLFSFGGNLWVKISISIVTVVIIVGNLFFDIFYNSTVDGMINEINSKGSLYVILVNYCAVFFPMFSFFAEMVFQILRNERNLKNIHEIGVCISKLQFSSKLIKKISKKRESKSSEIEKILKIIISNVKQYKSFLPQSLLNPDDSDDSGIYENQRRNISIKNSERNFQFGLISRNISIVVIFYENIFRGINNDEIERKTCVKRHQKFVEKIFFLFRKFRGCLNSFQDNYFVCSFNSVVRTVFHEKIACKFALKLYEMDENDDIKIYVSTEPCFLGNIGCREMKQFNIIPEKKGKGIEGAKKMVHLNSVLKTKILVSQKTFSAVKYHFCGVLKEFVEINDKTEKIYELRSERGIESGIEWNYAISHVLKSDTMVNMNWNFLKKNEVEKATNYLKNLLTEEPNNVDCRTLLHKLEKAKKENMSVYLKISKNEEIFFYETQKLSMKIKKIYYQ